MDTDFQYNCFLRLFYFMFQGDNSWFIFSVPCVGSLWGLFGWNSGKSAIVIP